jgi:hypothetical protein
MILAAFRAGISWTPNLPFLTRLRVTNLLITPYTYTHESYNSSDPVNYLNCANAGQNTVLLSNRTPRASISRHSFGPSPGQTSIYLGDSSSMEMPRKASLDYHLVTSRSTTQGSLSQETPSNPLTRFQRATAICVF